MVSVLLSALGFHLHIATLGKVVIFHCITGFQRGGFLPIISIYRKLASLWWLGQKEKT